MLPNNFKVLLKECIVEVLKEDLGMGAGSKCPECGTPDSKCNCKVVARVKAYSNLKKKAEAGGATPEEIQFLRKERVWVQSILRQAGYGVQGGMYPREEQQEGFEPTSTGPNIPEENPYPAWNAMMRQLEEEHPHGRYAQQAGATPLEPSINEAEAELYKSHGVTYGHIENGKTCPPDMKTFSYTLNHIPSGKKFPRQICCYNANDFYRLMRHWSLSNDWTCEPSDQTLQ